MESVSAIYQFFTARKWSFHRHLSVHRETSNASWDRSHGRVARFPRLDIRHGDIPRLPPDIGTGDLPTLPRQNPSPPPPPFQSGHQTSGPSPSPASDICWWSLENWSNLFIWHLPPGVTFGGGNWNWSTYGFQAGGMHLTGMLPCYH